MKKWESMISVSQWLASRINLRRTDKLELKLIDDKKNVLQNVPGNFPGNVLQISNGDSEIKGTEILTLPHIDSPKNNNNDDTKNSCNNADNLNTSHDSNDSNNHDNEDNNNNNDSDKNKIMKVNRRNDILLSYSPDMIELDLTRSVDLPLEAKKNWKSRNLPVVRGMEVKINCVQHIHILNAINLHLHSTYYW